MEGYHVIISSKEALAKVYYNDKKIGQKIFCCLLAESMVADGRVNSY